MERREVAVSILQEAEYDEVAEECEALGLVITQRLEELDLLLGSAEKHQMEAIRGVPGVIGVAEVEA